jgi:hypothetical protein
VLALSVAVAGRLVTSLCWGDDLAYDSTENTRSNVVCKGADGSSQRAGMMVGQPCGPDERGELRGKSC